MQKKRFSEIGLSSDLLKAIDRIGFEEASPIQSEAIPILLAGSDVVGQSQTGSGKTLAFAIPAIEKADASLRAPQVLILCPTRELVVQVAEEVARLSFFKRGLRELPIYGGQSYERQFRGLEQGSQIIIGTPGRVMDHLERGSLKLDHLKMVILDEADRMLDMGFVDDIRTVLSQAPVERQTVFFSATLPGPIQQLIKTFTKDPVKVEIAAQALTVPNIEQVYYEVDRRSKVDVLCRLIDIQDVRFGIIFCATKMMVDELVEHLVARGYSADRMHGDMTQAMREKVIARFRKRGIEFLVATDVAARGLDVDDIEVVFNYDLPHDGEDYIHRIGRTGRAGRSGKAVTFVAGREIYKMQNIIRFTKAKIKRERVPSLEEVDEKRANVFFESLRETLEKGEFEKQDEMIDRLLNMGYAPTDISSALIHLLKSDRTQAVKGGEGTGEDFRSQRRDAGEERRGKDGGGFRKFEKNRREDAGSAKRPALRGEPGDYKKAKAPEKVSGAKPKEWKDAPEPDVREPGMARIILGAGRDHKIQPADIVGVIAGVTKLSSEIVGKIKMRAKESVVDVVEEHRDLVLKKLSGIDFKGRKLWVKRA